MKLDMKKILCFFLIISSQYAFCRIRLPRLISDGMVLQREMNVKIWGWADEGERVTVNFNGKSYTASPNEDGQWTVCLDQMRAGGPYTLDIQGDNKIILKDIMIGDVWVCSGQSNMELSMERVSTRYPAVIANSSNPQIRQFFVPRKYDFDKPCEDFTSGRWESATPETVLDFTAVGYFFAKSLFERYHVPIGLINTALGGSPAEAWLSEEALQDFPNHLRTALQYRDDAFIANIERKNQQNQQTWYSQLDKKDRGLTNNGSPWYEVDVDTSEWSEMEIPGYWAQTALGPVNGTVWFRREFEVPDEMAGKPAKLLMGRIVDADWTYVNGTLVGTVSYQYPPRRYEIPEKLLKPGTNVIAVRVVNNAGGGGFVSDKPYQISAAGNTIDLKGKWKFRLGTTMDPLPPEVFIRWKPMGLYNAMIAPLTNYAMTGVIWYQGESNAGRAAEYRTLFPAVIADWRNKWGQGDFPFLYVQLANFMEAKDTPSESNWALLREAQLQTLTVPNTAMAVTIDLGEWNDIHPLNKEDVGKRLALAAQKIAYGEDVVYSGPIYDSMKIDGNKIILSFIHTGGGLFAKGGPLQSFAIAGEDKKFVWAKAEIDDDSVIVWNETVDNPVAVRYAWADNPQDANLYNKEGLPASPFRTDQ